MSPNPKDVGGTDTCDRGNEDNENAVLVVFEGLEFEFIYEIDDGEKVIRLINCKKLTFIEDSQNVRVEI